MILSQSDNNQIQISLPKSVCPELRIGFAFSSLENHKNLG